NSLRVEFKVMKNHMGCEFHVDYFFALFINQASRTSKSLNRDLRQPFDQEVQQCCCKQCQTSFGWPQLTCLAIPCLKDLRLPYQCHVESCGIEPSSFVQRHLQVRRKHGSWYRLIEQLTC